MNTTKKIDMMPEEKYIQDALRDGRGFRTEISLRAIGKPDYRFQARIETEPGQHLDIEHVSRLGRILETEERLHPIVVFFNPKTKKYLIADGFHRYDAYRRARKDAIPAYQINGDERDALEYCTMCNRLAMKTRTKEDVRKAAELLFSDDVWWHKSDYLIAEHIGLKSTNNIKLWRLEWAEKNSVVLPQEIITRSGYMYPASSRKKNCAPTIRKRKSGLYRACLNGKEVSLGRDLTSAQEKLAVVLNGEKNTQEVQRQQLRPYLLVSYFMRRNILTRLSDNSGLDGLGAALIASWGVIVCSKIGQTQAEFRDQIASVILNKIKYGVKGRGVVLCYDPPQCESLRIAREHLGIEFLTLEELAESLKGDQP